MVRLEATSIWSIFLTGLGGTYILGFAEDPEASGMEPCDVGLSVDRAAVAKAARRFLLFSSASASSSQSGNIEVRCR